MRLPAAMPTSERACLVLALGGHTYREIAGLLSLDPRRVLQEISSGLRWLQDATTAESRPTTITAS